MPTCAEVRDSDQWGSVSPLLGFGSLLLGESVYRDEGMHGDESEHCSVLERKVTS